MLIKKRTLSGIFALIIVLVFVPTVVVSWVIGWYVHSEQYRIAVEGELAGALGMTVVMDEPRPLSPDEVTYKNFQLYPFPTRQPMLYQADVTVQRTPERCLIQIPKCDLWMDELFVSLVRDMPLNRRGSTELLPASISVGLCDIEWFGQADSAEKPRVAFLSGSGLTVEFRPDWSFDFSAKEVIGGGGRGRCEGSGKLSTEGLSFTATLTGERYKLGDWVLLQDPMVDVKDLDISALSVDYRREQSRQALSETTSARFVADFSETSGLFFDASSSEISGGSCAVEIAVRVKDHVAEFVSIEVKAVDSGEEGDGLELSSRLFKFVSFLLADAPPDVPSGLDTLGGAQLGFKITFDDGNVTLAGTLSDEGHWISCDALRDNRVPYPLSSATLPWTDFVARARRAIESIASEQASAGPRAPLPPFDSPSLAAMRSFFGL